ncbi:CsbD family protein [Halomonas alkaliantarctica]|nr:CsbD family protein [Halomonas alkaliantarctica]
MNWDQIEGRWAEMKGKARATWGELTDGDLEQIGGKRDELVGKLQQRYGLAKEEAERKVDEWANGR